MYLARQLPANVNSFSRHSESDGQWQQFPIFCALPGEPASFDNDFRICYVQAVIYRFKIDTTVLKPL